MQKNQIIKILIVLNVVLLIKSIIFGLWHFGSLREMYANVLLPIAIHIIGGLGTVFLAWWLIDKDVRTQAKKEEWERIFAKAFSDLRRNVWLAYELRNQTSNEHSYARYWINGLHELRLKLPNKHSAFERVLWSLIHQFDLCNKMLEQQSVTQASQEAAYLIEQIKSLRPYLQELSKSLVDLKIEEPNFSELFMIQKPLDLKEVFCESRS